MNYSVTLDNFEGPLDLLLHLIKKDNINITEINIEKITKQYLEYINKMEQLNLDIASEYLIMAAELIELKSKDLLPVEEIDEEIEEENTKEKLIQKLYEYEQYKNISQTLKTLEEIRGSIYTKEIDELNKFKEENKTTNLGIDLNDLLEAYKEFVKQKEISKPLDTKISTKEYSITKRSLEIKNILKNKKKINFCELFEINNKNYIIITFLSVLALVKKQEIEIEQENNFKNIIIKDKGE